MTCSRRKFVIGLGSVALFTIPASRALAGNAVKAPARYVMIHDESLCNGCNLCTVACRKVNNVPTRGSRLGIAHIQLTSPEDGNKYHFFRQSCQHCDDAPCITVCPTGASFRDIDGVVRVNRETCIGCSYCISACPYQVRYLNPYTHVADKCDFCTETRLSKGFDPICVSVCPQKALIFGREDSQPIQQWLKEHDYYLYQLKGVGKPHIYRLLGESQLIKESV